MARHSEITGSVTSRTSKGQTVWLVRLNYGPDPDTGKRRQPWDDQRFATEKEARKRLTYLLHEANRGPRVDPTRRTVEQLITEWLQHEAVTSVREGTFEDYESICRVHLLPAFGSQLVNKLTSSQIERWRIRKLAAGHSPGVVARCTLHLGQALKYGIRHGYLTANPVAALGSLRTEHNEMQIWTPQEAAQFLKVAATQSYHPVWALALHTGMRKGELIGVRWDDLDLEGPEATLRVRRSLGWAGGVLKIEDTKSRLARTIDLNRDLVAILREHRIRQAQHRLRIGPAWHDDGWVCASEIGTPINPYNITRAYHALQVKAGVRRIRFHDLRHTCASMLLAAGVPVHIVSRQLGHASAAITMRVYAHLMPGQGSAAAEVLRRTLALEG